MPIMNSDFSKLYNELNGIYDDQLLEAKADIDSFINKFGENTYNHFLKAKDRLRNNGHSVDLTWYVKNMEKEDLDELIISLYNKDTDQQKKRIIQGIDKEIRGNYNYLGEKNGYKVYQPLDVKASMDLGVNTGWCTAGRYGHYGHPEFTPSLKDAKQHWDDYTKKGIKFYYFLNPKTMYGEYALALYPRVLDVNKDIDDGYLQKTNFELFDAEDDKDYLAVNKLPLDLIGEEIVLKAAFFDEQGLAVLDNTVVSCKKDTTNVVIPDGITTIGKAAFYTCTNLKSITIPNSVTSIENSAFEDCKSLKSITIPNSVTIIGTYAFAWCKSLTSITIPNSVTSISNNAFTGCHSLTSVTISDGVKLIGGSVFAGCESLTSITIPNSVTLIGHDAFSGCSSLESIILPNSITSIGDYTFYYCQSLTSITIPNSIKSIGEAAFSRCPSLTSITIPDSVTSIGYRAFYECPSLTVYTNNEYAINYCNENKIKYQKIN